MGNSIKVFEEQKLLCAKYGVKFYSCGPDDRAGVALATLLNEPVHGSRERNEDGTSSWYIWAGEYSTDPDFYQPLCAGHIENYLPLVMPYLALPPGYKFIIDRNGYEDVWIDETA